MTTNDKSAALEALCVRLLESAEKCLTAADQQFSEADFEIHYTHFAQAHADLFCTVYDTKAKLAALTPDTKDETTLMENLERQPNVSSNRVIPARHSDQFDSDRSTPSQPQAVAEPIEAKDCYDAVKKIISFLENDCQRHNANKYLDELYSYIATPPAKDTTSIRIPVDTKRVGNAVEVTCDFSALSQDNQIEKDTTSDVIDLAINCIKYLAHIVDKHDLSNAISLGEVRDPEDVIYQLAALSRGKD